MTDIMNWAVLTITYQLTATGLTIITTTDIPVHCFMRYTTTEPQKHIIPRLVRGAAVGTFIDQCFVEYTDNEQEEPGDTLTHTFIKDPWPHCETRWFFFWGKKAGLMTYSASPLFKKHRKDPIASSDCQLTHDEWAGFCQRWNASGMIFTPDHQYQPHSLTLMLAQYDLLRRGPYRVKIAQVDGPCWNEATLWQKDGHSTELPVFPTMTPSSYSPSGFILHTAVPYRIVIHTLPGWERWTGTFWTPEESYAALYFRFKKDTNPYTRGGRCSGCNFAASSGSWAYYPQHDLYFCIYEAPP